MSPSQRHDGKSPSEVLYAWLYEHSLPHIAKPERPDGFLPEWGGLKIYGSRAYPLKREREKGADNRLFKVSPRGHIGYLVGYVNSNIYRIWIPRLERVITTRNVRIKERLYYDQASEATEAIPIQEADDLYDELLEESTPSKPPVITPSATGFSASSNSGVEECQSERDAGTKSPPTLNITTAQRPMTPEGQTGDPQNSINEPRASSSTQTEEDESGMTGEEPISPASPPYERQEEEIHVRTDLATPDEEEPLEPEPQQQSDSEEPSPEPSGAQSQEGTPDQAPAQETSAPGSTETVAPEELSPSAESEPLNSGEQETSVPSVPAAPEASSERIFRSERLQAREAEGRNMRWGKKTKNEGNYATLLFDDTDELLKSIFPNQEGNDMPDLESFITVFAVIASSATQSTTSRTTDKHRDNLPKAPNNWKEMLNHPLRELFFKATQDEMAEVHRRGTMKIMPRSEATGKPIPLKWVFTYKLDQQGYLIRCKARIVVRGDLQEVEDSETTYAATLTSRALRIMVAVAAFFDLDIEQFDIKNAFLNAMRTTQYSDVYVELPPGYEQKGKCALLMRALYGLRDSPYLWLQEFTKTLASLDLVQCTEEPCLFYTKDKKIFIVFFVDDILLLSQKSERSRARQLMADLAAKYEMHSQGPAEWFLGIRIIRDRPNRLIYLSHEDYIEKITVRYGLRHDSKRYSSPLPSVELEHSTGQAAKPTIKRYQELVGSILYTAIMVRPDVAYPASFLSRFLTNPSPEHMDAAEHVIRYLWGTRSLCLRFGKSKEAQFLLIASDASFADDKRTRHSSQGYIIFLYGGPVIWKASKQATVTTSTTEAELLSLAHTAKEAMALRRFNEAIGLKLPLPYELFCDNQQTIRLIVCSEERINTRLRHVDIHNMWLKQEYQKGQFIVTYLPSGEMPADGLTKKLSTQQFERFRAMLGLITAKKAN